MTPKSDCFKCTPLLLKFLYVCRSYRKKLIGALLSSSVQHYINSIFIKPAGQQLEYGFFSNLHVTSVVGVIYGQRQAPMLK